MGCAPLARLAGSVVAMPPYGNDSRDRVREAVDFVELVSARTELRSAGANRYTGLCPFHEERTPSFGIDPVQKLYHCFGCGASGDLFRFVEETEGVDFKGALELLAERYGVELKPAQEDPRAAARRRSRERLLGLLERTADYYERYLWESREAARARAYLLGRGLQEATLRTFRVGYAPSAWDRVLSASLRGGFSEQELQQAGLVQRNAKSGQAYDRFRGRVMFPLTDVRGRVLGFGARAMRSEQGPKYLNSADNDLYHKGHHLFGANLARAHAARVGEVIVCEGYTDVIALHGGGLTNCVGLMGTAMTATQVGELARLAPRILLALDADSAGQQAMMRAAELAAKRRLELRVVKLPRDGIGSEHSAAAPADPAELIQRDGAEAMKRAAAQSVSFARFRIERILDAGDYSDAEGRERVLSELRPAFATLRPGPMRMELTRLVSGRLALPEGVTETLLAASARPHLMPPDTRAHGERTRAGVARKQGPGDEGEPRASGALSRREQVERTFLALCIAFPKHGARALNDVELDEHFTGELLRRAAAHLRAGRLAEPTNGLPDDDPQLVGMIGELVAQAGALGAAGVQSDAGPGRDRSGAANQAPAIGVEAAAAKVEVQRLQLELARLERLIQAARSQRSGEVSKVAARRAEIKRAFDQAQQRALDVAGSGHG
jgi:DNA primase